MAHAVKNSISEIRVFAQCHNLDLLCVKYLFLKRFFYY